VKPKLIVHIGSPYTKANTVQKGLLFLAHRLRPECGVHHASTERGKHSTRHTSVAKSALGNPAEARAEREALLDDFRRSKAHTLLLTDEGLFAPKTRLPKFFKELARDFDITVICFLIRQDYFVEAMYRQALRSRHFKDVPDIQDFVGSEMVVPRLDYHAILKDWADVATSMQVRDFRSESEKHGVLGAFQAAAGWEQLGALEKLPELPAVDFRMMLTMRLLGSGVPENDAAELLKALYRADRALTVLQGTEPRSHSLGRRERDTLLERCAASNEKLASRFGVRFSDERPDEPELPPTKPDAHYLMGLMGELSPVEAMRLYRASQGYWLRTLADLPEQKLVPPQLADASLSEGEATPAETMALARSDSPIQQALSASK
jgi:hypothetical protein